ITPTLRNEFTGLILIPCIGNLPEHFIAIISGRNNKMDLVIETTAGSVLQLSFLVLPIIVISGWIMGSPIDVEEETLCRMNWKNSDIKNIYDFRLIHEEVKKINLNYSSIIAKFDTEDKIKKYEESEEFKYIINHESLRQYRLLY
ncbi:784_t:CDS:2, partial [Scutellospora calospora]